MTSAMPASIAGRPAFGLILEERLLLGEAEGHDGAVDGDRPARDDERLGRRVGAEPLDDGRPGGQQLIEVPSLAPGDGAVAAARGSRGAASAAWRGVGARGGAAGLPAGSLVAESGRGVRPAAARAWRVGAGRRRARRRGAACRRAPGSAVTGRGRRGRPVSAPEPDRWTAARPTKPARPPTSACARTSRARAGSAARRSRPGWDRWRPAGGRRRPGRAGSCRALAGSPSPAISSARIASTAWSRSARMSRPRSSSQSSSATPAAPSPRTR